MPLPVEGQTCSQCREPYPSEDLLWLGRLAVCGRCKPLFVQRLVETGITAADSTNYGGFWIRGGARLIDAVLLWVVMSLLTVIFLGGSGFLMRPPMQDPWALLRVEGIVFFLQFVIAATYEIALTATTGATLGKHALSLRIVSADEQPFGWGRAVGRYFAQAITQLTVGVGYVMAAFDPQKRALHDHICGTRVVRK